MPGKLGIGHEELVPLLVVLVDDSADNGEQETGGDDPNNDGGGRRKSESSFASRGLPKRAAKQKRPNTWSCLFKKRGQHSPKKTTSSSG